MARKGPLITLAGGGALAAVLLAASVNAASGDGDDRDLAGDETAASPAPASSPAASESPAQEVAEDPEPVTYVGNVDGGGASVAIIVDGEEATAYVCDGYAVEAWLTGTARNGELVLSAENGELLGSYNDESATGEITAAGLDRTFTVGQVDPPDGLYQFADTVVGGAEVEGTWIVLPDGTQVGLAYVDGEISGTLEADDPAPSIDLETGDVVLNDVPVAPARLG